MGRRISCPEFIGRTEESRALAAALERARRGEAPTVLVGGEAGIGKSRLVGELARAATDGGARVLVGGCAPLGQSPPPLMPVADALRAYARSTGPEERAGLPPALALLVPELAAEDAVVESGPGDGQVFDRLLDALETLAAERTLAVVLEDLHWADRSTLDLLALRTQTQRVPGCLVVATYRSDELAAGDPLRLLLAELERSGRTERLELRPFDRSETIAQITGILDAPPAPEVVEDVVARADGNPFFVEELLAAHGGTSSTLEDVVLARVGTLPERTQAVLRILSAARRSLEHDTLATVSGTDERRLDGALRKAIDRHMIVTTDDGAYAFRHALLREAVYARLLPAERIRLHGAIARSIGTGRRDPHLLADLAYHWYGADDLPRAFAAAVEAGLAADRIFGLAEALGHYERALELWESVRDPARRAGMDRVALVARAAEAASGRGESERAARLAEEALGQVDPAADPLRAGELLERLGRYRWIGGDTADALVAYEEAVAIIPSTPSVARARVLAALAHVLLISGRWNEARTRAGEAVRIARDVGAVLEEGRALATFGGADPDAEDGVRIVREARSLLEGAGAPPDVVFTTYSYETGLLEDAGRLEETVDAARAGVEFTGRHGMHRNHQTWMEALAAFALIKLGRWAEADAVLESAILKAPTGITRLAVQLARAELQLARGEVDTAAESVADGMHAVRGDQPLTGSKYDILAAVDLARRDLDAARATVAEGLSRGGVLDDRHATARLCRRGLEVEATRAERERAGRKAVDVSLAAALLDRARQVSDGAEGDALRRACEAEYARACDDPAADLWHAAAAAWDTLRQPWPAAYSRLREAEAALGERRPRSAAETPLRWAHATARELGAVTLLKAAESVARRARLELEPNAAEPGRPAEQPLGLTKRELQVLRLVGQGYTNLQIADTLFISRKTAGAHVSSILAKLGVARRVQAAAMAQRLDLLD